MLASARSEAKTLGVLDGELIEFSAAAAKLNDEALAA